MTRFMGVFAAIFCFQSIALSAGAIKYSLYETTPTSDAQVAHLVELWKHNDEYDIDFWQSPTRVNSSVHFMAPANDVGVVPVLRHLAAHKFHVDKLVDDVESKIKQRKAEHEGKLRRRKRQARSNLDVRQYHTYADIMGYIRQLESTYPQLVKVITIGYSHERRPITVVKIGSSTGRSKPGIWIDGGIHAREWIAPATAVWMIDKLVRGYLHDPEVRRLVDELDWYILPVLNVDGYEFSHSSTAPEVRLWRKNRAPEVCIGGGQFSVFSPFAGNNARQCCRGVDLNRNYDFYWGGEGSSSDPCSEIYQGTSAFSEPETRATRDFLLANRRQIKAVITMHSYSQIWMYPYGHKRNTYPPDVADLRRVALEARAALSNLYGTQYSVGTGADTLYPASGGADDWAKTGAGIKYTYLIELRPSEQVWDGFLLDENQIEPTGRETFAGIKSVANNIIKEFGTNVAHTRASQSVNQARPPTSNCRDSNANCAFWATHGACQAWPLTRKQCPKSCGVCPNIVRQVNPSVTRCIDFYKECPQWAALNLCAGQNSLAVRQQCPKSCGQC